MKEIRSSHVLYMILNPSGSLFVDKNRDFRIYKTKAGLKDNMSKYKDKKVAVFTLTDIKDIDEVIED